MKKLAIIIALFSFYAFTQSNPEPKKPVKEISVLFIGNSLTYSNDLPKLVKKAARQKGILLKTKSIAYPNYAISDHWNGGTVQKLISSKEFDYVIIQQGPSSQDEGKQMLIETGKKFKDLCNENDTQLCFFMVWPSLNYYNTFEDVIQNYTMAAEVNDAILLPVGQVWKQYLDTAKKLNYYGKDGFHPSLKGSKIAANVILDNLIENMK